MNDEIRSKYKNIENYSTILKVDEFGFIISSSDDNCSPENNSIRIYKSEWDELLDSNYGDFKKLKIKIQARKLLQRGVPAFIRKRIWRTLLMKEIKYGLFHIRRSFVSTSALNLIYKNILPYRLSNINPSEDLIGKFESLKLKNSEYEYQIHVDVQRTFRQHYLFHNSFERGQLELFNLLVAFANFHREIGYCQGMSDIAAIFLIHYSEGEAFEMMSVFFTANNMDKIFDKKFSKIPQLLKLQIQFLYTLSPDIHNHLIENIETVNMCFVSWYLTLFTRFPTKLTLRIWDFMMLYGIKVILYFATAILYVHKKQILLLQGDELLMFINRLEEMPIGENEIVEVVDIAANFMEEFKYKELQ